MGLRFSCEHCSEERKGASILWITQHKGGIFVEWKEVPHVSQ